MSRWLVGSSIRRTSGSPSRTRAIATRIFHAARERPDIGVYPLRRRSRASAESRGCGSRGRSRRDAHYLPGRRRSVRASHPCRRPSTEHRHRVLKVFELVVKRAQPPAAGNRFVEHQSAGHFLHVLPEVADGHLSRHQHYFPIVRALLAGDHPEEGDLPGAVRTHEAAFLPLVQLERGIDGQPVCGPAY